MPQLCKDCEGMMFPHIQVYRVWCRGSRCWGLGLGHLQSGLEDAAGFCRVPKLRTLEHPRPSTLNNHVCGCCS